MANRISTIFEFSERGSGLKKIQADVQATEGSFGKMKVASKGAFDQIKAVGPQVAATVGVAVAGAAVKAGQEFADAAIQVGQFSDATGLSTEEASKWVSVTDDLGLNAEDMLKVFQRLNKEIGEGDGVVAEYGIQLKRTADGAADINGTMLEAIDVVNGIKDPTERARVAQELFGRSYANVAEIVFNSAEKVQAQLESTSDAQIFDQDEVNKARDYRAAMDELNDVLTDLTMTVGEGVVPVLSDMSRLLVDINGITKKGGGKGFFETSVDAIQRVNPIRYLMDYNNAVLDLVGLSGDAELITSDLYDSFDDDALKRSLDNLNGWNSEVHASASALDEAKAANHEAGKEIEQRGIEEMIAAEATRDARRATEHHVTVLGEAKEANRRAAEATERHREAIAALFDEIDNNLSTTFDYEEATMAVEDAIKDFADAAVNALEVANDSESSMADREQALRDMRGAEIDAANAALDASAKYAESQDAIQGTTEFAMLQREELSRLADEFPELRDEIALFIAELDRIPAVKTVSLVINRSGTNAALAAAGTGARADEFGNLIPGRASGGPVSAGGTYLVGERGPELLTMGSSAGFVTPNHAIGGGVSIGPVVVQAPAGADADQFGRAVRDAIVREMRFNGPVSGWAA